MLKVSNAQFVENHQNVSRELKTSPKSCLSARIFDSADSNDFFKKGTNNI